MSHTCTYNIFFLLDPTYELADGIFCSTTDITLFPPNGRSDRCPNNFVAIPDEMSEAMAWDEMGECAEMYPKTLWGLL